MTDVNDPLHAQADYTQRHQMKGDQARAKWFLAGFSAGFLVGVVIFAILLNFPH